MDIRLAGFTSSSVYGGFVAASGTKIEVNSKVASCGTAITGNAEHGLADGDGLPRVNAGMWGTHFIVSSIYSKWWGSAELTWDWSVATDSPNSKCGQITYRSLIANDNKDKNIIYCPVDEKIGGTNPTTMAADKKLQFSSFSVPYYVGKGTTHLKYMLGYVWTNTYGEFKIYEAQAGDAFAKGQDANTGDKCTVEAKTPAYAKSGKSQKITFTMKIT